MSDVFTATLMAKTISGIGGLIGGVSFMVFYRPSNVWDASVRSGLSVTAAIVFAPILMEYINLQMNMEYLIATSFCLGFCSWSILSLLARFLIRVQDEKVNIKLPNILSEK
jgi:hypothetical protein